MQMLDNGGYISRIGDMGNRERLRIVPAELTHSFHSLISRSNNNGAAPLAKPNVM